MSFSVGPYFQLKKLAFYLILYINCTLVFLTVCFGPNKKNVTVGYGGKIIRKDLKVIGASWKGVKREALNNLGLGGPCASVLTSGDLGLQWAVSIRLVVEILLPINYKLNFDVTEALRFKMLKKKYIVCSSPDNRL